MPIQIIKSTALLCNFATLLRCEQTNINLSGRFDPQEHDSKQRLRNAFSNSCGAAFCRYLSVLTISVLPQRVDDEGALVPGEHDRDGAEARRLRSAIAGTVDSNNLPTKKCCICFE